MAIKVKFESGHFVPLVEEEVEDLDNGKIIEIEIIKKNKDFSWKGALKHIKKSSVELQHEIKNVW